MTLSYDVVIATRDRPEALILSLPLLLDQTRKPASIVVIDSSDDPEPNRKTVSEIAEQAPFPVSYTHSKAGLTYQRNLGIDRCSADVIIFPDDDSLLFPDAAEELMKVYERDTEQTISSVGGQQVFTPPPASELKLDVFEGDRGSPIRVVLRRIRQWMTETSASMHPFLVIGHRLNARWKTPDWLASEDVSLVPYVTGFRMSFRSAVFEKCRFDEALKTYAWFEDIDACHSAMRSGAVTVSDRARIFHYAALGKRGNAWQIGQMSILNRAYLMMKHIRANPDVFSPGKEALRVRFYLWFRVFGYLLTIRDSYGLTRFRGAFTAARQIGALLRAPETELSETFKRLHK